MPSLKLVPASKEDIPTIAELAKLIWNQHYPSIIGQKQINYMLRLMYSAKSLGNQLEQKSNTFYLIDLKSKKVGFISVTEEKNKQLFLNKFYINQLMATKGLGTKSFNELIQLHQPKKVTLTVNRQNYKSINFYFRLGFKIERVADFDIGNNYVMNDFVMIWTPKNNTFK